MMILFGIYGALHAIFIYNHKYKLLRTVLYGYFLFRLHSVTEFEFELRECASRVRVCIYFLLQSWSTQLCEPVHQCVAPSPSHGFRDGMFGLKTNTRHAVLTHSHAHCLARSRSVCTVLFVWYTCMKYAVSSTDWEFVFCALFLFLSLSVSFSHSIRLHTVHSIAYTWSVFIHTNIHTFNFQSSSAWFAVIFRVRPLIVWSLWTAYRHCCCCRRRRRLRCYCCYCCCWLAMLDSALLCCAMFMVCEMRYFQSFTSSPAVWMCRRCFAHTHHTF